MKITISGNQIDWDMFIKDVVPVITHSADTQCPESVTIISTRDFRANWRVRNNDTGNMLCHPNDLEGVMKCITDRRKKKEVLKEVL